MKSINYDIRKAYVEALSDITVNTNPSTPGTRYPVPVYYLSAPQSETSKFYIIINGPSSTDISTINSSDTNTQVQLQIQTWGDGSNSGWLADNIAENIFSVIYTTPQKILDLTGMGLQMVSTKLITDNTSDITGLGNAVYITRTLIFEHNIFHN